MIRLFVFVLFVAFCSAMTCGEEDLEEIVECPSATLDVCENQNATINLAVCLTEAEKYRVYFDTEFTSDNKTTPDGYFWYCDKTNTTWVCDGTSLDFYEGGYNSVNQNVEDFDTPCYRTSSTFKFPINLEIYNLQLDESSNVHIYTRVLNSAGDEYLDKYLDIAYVTLNVTTKPISTSTDTAATTATESESTFSGRSNSDHGLSGAAIAGIVIGAVATLALILLIIYRCKKNR